MPRTQLNLFGGYYESSSLPLSHQNCINWIPIVVEDGALSQNAMLTPSSLTQFATGGASPNRGGQNMAGVPYFINGNILYSIDASGNETSIGSIQGSGRVSIANNGLKLCVVVPGGKGYVYDSSTSTLAEITDPDYIISDTVVFKDGYFVFTASDGGVFFNSELNDPTNIDPLDFGTAEINPDKIVAAHVNHNELFILGEETIEIFQNIGGSGFPFQRIQGANIQKGCYAKFSPVEFDNTFLFVGGGKNEKAGIWRVASSQSAQKISTDAIDHAIQKFTDDEISDAFSTTFTIAGQFIATFTFESTRIDPITFCYNGTSQKWFQLQTGINDGRWRVNSIVKAHGKLLCGDSVDGRIGYLDDVFTEYGATIYRERTTQPFILDGNSVYWPEIELGIESGVGLTTGQGSDPKIRMSYSDNGSRTFTPEKSRSFGKIGEYNKRAIWRRNGRVPSNRVLRFTETDPVLCNLTRLDGVIEQGYG
jgi:hypothetical protein